MFRPSLQRLVQVISLYSFDLYKTVLWGKNLIGIRSLGYHLGFGKSRRNVTLSRSAARVKGLILYKRRTSARKIFQVRILRSPNNFINPEISKSSG